MRDKALKRTWRNWIVSGWDLITIRINGIWSTYLTRMSLWWQGCLVERGFKAQGICKIRARRSGSISLGRQVTLVSAFNCNLVGLGHRCILQTMGDGIIEIGDYSGGSGVVISARSHIRIGKHVKLGGNVRIYDHDFHSVDPDHRRSGGMDQQNVRSFPVLIGDDVFIGANAIILKGVSIGDRAIIGAASVVAKDVPADEVWAGNPARLVRALPTVELP